MDAGRPISHVAAEAGVSRRCLAKWYARWLADGEDGLYDHTSRPTASLNRTSDDVAIWWKRCGARRNVGLPGWPPT